MNSRIVLFYYAYDVVRTPLHLACAIGNVAIVEKLLSWKALINVPDRENKTPLFKV